MTRLRRSSVLRAFHSISSGTALLLLPAFAAQAGDILRGGMPANPTRQRPNAPTANAGQDAGQDAANRSKANASDRLSRTTQAIQSVQALQTSAREAARAAQQRQPGLSRADRQALRVPDGLARRGLKLDQIVSGALDPVEIRKGDKVTVTIEQTDQQAILNWKSFNVGKKTTLVFDQSAGGENAGEWIAFNRVTDPFGQPSKILGSIKAEGQVYVLNQNGILFGGSSQVNVHTLVASALPINDNLIQRGLINNPDSQFLFSALPQSAGRNGTPSFTPPNLLTPPGDVVVQAGAILESPTSPEKIGGRIVLVGANVENAGTIATPDGQTILAAGSQVGFTPHASDDASLRGLDVHIGEVDDRAGTAINSGLISASRASVIIAGSSVQQNGVIDSSSSVALNGRVDLLANFGAISNPAYDPEIPANGPQFLYRSTGTVTLGKGSITRILPETDSAESVIGTELALRSQFNAQGLAVHVDRDAVLLAPNATVDIRAGAWDFVASDSRPLSNFAYTSGQIYVEPGALIDVAGTTDVFVPQSQNLLKIELRGAELADSPLQRASFLRAIELIVDARVRGEFNGSEWIGTPLGDVTGYYGLIQRTVAQLTTAGGSVSMQAGTSVVLRDGSNVDVSGGWVTYEGGILNTTKLRYGSQIIDISEATPDRVYDGFYTTTTTVTNAKWGITKTFTQPLLLKGATYEDNYISGADGGSIAITAPAMALDGKLAGAVVNGPKQVRENATTSVQAGASSLTLTFKGQDPAPYAFTRVPWISPTPPDIVFRDGASRKDPGEFAFDAEGVPLALFDADDVSLLTPFALPAVRENRVILNPSLLGENGFGSLVVDNADGDITVPAGVTLNVQPKGALTLTGANIDVQGDIIAPGGALKFTVHDFSPFKADIYLTDQLSDKFRTPDPRRGRGRFTLAGTISTAGLTVDDHLTAQTRGVPRLLVLDGGSVAIDSYSVDLAPGSVIDVSGGVAMSPWSELSFGDGGSISIEAGQDPKIASLLGGKIALDGELRGFSGATGGALTIQAPLVQVGGTVGDGYVLTEQIVGGGEFGHPLPGTEGLFAERTRYLQPLLIDPGFFNEGGFTSFTLNGIGALTNQTDLYVPAVVIAKGTVIEPVAKRLVPVPVTEGGDGLRLKEVVRREGLRSPVSLAFGATGARDTSTELLVVRGEVRMEVGSRITTDAGASVKLSGQTVDVQGSIFAPGGSITVTGANSFPSLFNSDANPLPPSPTVFLGSKSVLSTAGKVVRARDEFGRRVGAVYGGGSIAVSGNIFAAAGAVLDVSGTHGILDVSPLVAGVADSPLIAATSGITAPLAKLGSVPVRVDSDAGSITLTGGQMLFTDATLVGNAGGRTALGGSLEVSSGRYYPPAAVASPLDVTLEVTEGKTTIAVAPLRSIFHAGERSPIGQSVYDKFGQLVEAKGYFDVSQFEQGGFDSLTLGGTVAFRGPVTIDARQSLKVATAGVLYADDHVELSAPYVALGMPFRTPMLDEQTPDPFTLAGLPLHFAPTHGPGSITVRADLIDVGNLSLQNIHSARLFAINGEIRGEGTVNVAGALRLRAAQIYPVTGQTFSLIAYDFASGKGLVDIRQSGGPRALPLSAGGTLNVYASVIHQGGTLVAPLGTINLGWDGTGDAPTDLIAGNTAEFPVTQRLVLDHHSTTSVSAIDPITGEGVLIPYGISFDGNSWIDPAGNDITAGGLPQKQIHLAGEKITTRPSSTIDVRGGGDLYAYRWIEGNGGTRDILASEGSFAILPGYDSAFAPYAPFNDSTLAENLQSERGYVNSTLRVGDQIYLDGSDSLPAGTYTLLPARYALLPGAVLVKPKSGTLLGALEMPGGYSLVGGYRFNSLNAGRSVSEIRTQFEVAPASVVRARAQYEDLFANTFLRESAARLGISTQPLPVDSGNLVFEATEAMRLLGGVSGQAPVGGRGAFVDISSPTTIEITGPGVKPSENRITLDASRLSSWGVESFLIGGLRERTEDGTTVAVETGRIVVDNAGFALSAPEIILAANERIRLAAGAEVVQSGSLTLPAETLQIDGDGAFVRVSSDINAETIRSNITDAKVAELSIGRGSIIRGNSIALDSSYATRLDGRAILDADAYTFNSGQITIRMGGAGDIAPTDGLVLRGRILRQLEDAASLSLLSYTSIDIYGVGRFGSGALGNLELHAGSIRGFDNAGGSTVFMASNVLLDNAAASDASAFAPAQSGGLVFRAGTIHLGSGRLSIGQYDRVQLAASRGVIADSNGRFLVDGDLTLTAPLITGATGSTQTIDATGALRLLAPSEAAAASITPGLGASLTLRGASVTANTAVSLPSGLLEILAKKGNVTVNGTLDVGGTAQRFNDLVRYTDAGSISLVSRRGDVNLGETGVLDLSAERGGGNAGTLSIGAARGKVNLDGAFAAAPGARGLGGSFALDVGRLPELGDLNAALNEAQFTESRSFRIRHGDVTVNGLADVRDFALSADGGSIQVTGTVDASGATGGSILLAASGSVSLLGGSVLTVAGEDFDSAGKGGSISLEAGAQIDGVVDSAAMVNIENGSTIDLSVANANGDSAALGRFTGTLHLRAPQTAGSTDVQVAAIRGDIRGASSVIVEGFQVYDLTGTGGIIDSTIQNAVRTNAQTLLGAAGTTTADYTAMRDRLIAGNSALDRVLSIRAGAEIINRDGDLTLGSPTANQTASQAASPGDWDLSSFRFGPDGAPGVLTLRASGDLVFPNSLSDGFASSAYNAALFARNPDLPANVQSWSYRLAAGADFSAADFHEVQPLSRLADDRGSLKLGRDNGTNVSNSNGVNNPAGANAQTRLALRNRYQVIRTGSGDIDIAAGRDIQLLNHFATIYTAGTLVDDPTMGGRFDVPILQMTGNAQGSLGNVQQNPAYPAQYTLGGGNVTLFAQGDIAHYTRNSAGDLVADSQRQIPNNWLYKRGYIDPLTGQWGLARWGDVASTTWWVDFSNFFQGVGALGGGNVSMIAGRNIANVDAVVPTNARMPKDTRSADQLVELGGGDLRVQAGNDLDAGVYYVERGRGSLSAGGDIVTNATRSPSLGAINNPPETFSPETWLPTTLFAGKSTFDVQARGDVLLGPAVNSFLLPGGFNNTYWYKTYFSTYAADSGVNVQSLGGAVTLRQGAALAASGTVTLPILQIWIERQLLFNPTTNPRTASYYQPWLRLNEASVTAFRSVSALNPGTLRVTAFGGDIDLVGDLTLSPSPRGTLELAAAGEVNGLNPAGVVMVNDAATTAWGTSVINVSDADPGAIPDLRSPFAYQSLVGDDIGLARASTADFLAFIDNLFRESGSLDQNLQSKQALHADGLLHRDDRNPLRIYALDGDISGLTLFSPKRAQILAGRDITDVGLYVQNLHESDVTVVAAGRDLVLYNAGTASRAAAQSPGNILNLREEPLSGDIQLAGPGVLEVFAGRRFDLGTGASNDDGTRTGISTIGNARNPSLPFAGAGIIAGAGIGAATSLTGSALDFDTFVDEFLGDEQAEKYLDELGVDLGDREFADLPRRQRDQIALAAFYLILRDSGRAFATAGTAAYDTGFAAIDALFGAGEWTGDIEVRSRDIRTRSGGDISLFAPGGGLTLASSTIGNPLTPPGIVTESGGNIGIFTDGDVNIGIGRIFTLRGGNEIIWSSTGDIAAGASSKTVKSAPPTRVLLDPQSADVKTDLAGLATGGGIGVLATVEGVPPGDVDLIAPVGVVDAGDAGIRVSGNLNIAATAVLNASNISVAGTASGVPSAPVIAAPNIAGLTAASNAAGSATSAANDFANQMNNPPEPGEEPPSIIVVDVLGYGGDEE